LKGYDEPEILRSQLSRFGPISADAGQSEAIDRGSPDDDIARNMADALTYLGRVARAAGYHSVAADLAVLRDKVNRIAEAEAATPPKRASA